VLKALIGGVESQTAGPGLSMVGLPGESGAADAAASLRLAALAAGQSAADVTDAATGLPATGAQEAAERSEAAMEPGSGQVLPQPAAAAVIQPLPAPVDAQGSAQGRGVAATLAGGRQQLPTALPVEAADAQPGQLAFVPGRSDPDAAIAQPGMADVTARAAQHPVQAEALVATERPFDAARTAHPREALAMQLPLRAQGWEGEFAQRIVWMAGRQAQWADISLNPPNLGNVEVHLSLKGNDASAYFYSPHAAVREAIDDSLSRLREMLAGVGISLGQTQVSQESFGERRAGAGTEDGRPGVAAIEPETAVPLRVGRGLVDLYV
jgi:flagellar hook-length control protein FliK